MGMADWHDGLYWYEEDPVPDAFEEYGSGRICFCAVHCANRCEPSHCDPWIKCDCWCHKREGS